MNERICLRVSTGVYGHQIKHKLTRRQYNDYYVMSNGFGIFATKTNLCTSTAAETEQKKKRKEKSAHILHFRDFHSWFD